MSSQLTVSDDRSRGDLGAASRFSELTRQESEVLDLDTDSHGPDDGSTSGVLRPASHVVSVGDVRREGPIDWDNSLMLITGSSDGKVSG